MSPWIIQWPDTSPPIESSHVMNEHPALILIMLAIGTYVLHIWREDLLAWKNGRPNPGALPGATTATNKACAIAIAGALVILTLETSGEIALRLDQEQSTITVFFGLYTLMAAFVEELIFRGFIVVENKGRALRWIGVIGASAAFAALHPFLWKWDDAGLTATLTAKGWFSTALVFVSSVWFYMMRFASFNINRSLIPSIAAHAAKNLGVFTIKGMQGFVNGWW